jgi:uncharacterized membrane protein
MFARPRFIPWERLMLSNAMPGLRLVCLPLAVFLFACQAPDDTMGPGGNDEPATEGTRPSADQLLAQATPPGLRWFRDHTHRVVARAPATFSNQLFSSRAISITEPTDLGTSFSSNTASIAEAINAAGQLAGWTVTVEGPQTSRAIRWDVEGTPTVLSRTSEESETFARDLNDVGVVVGSAVEPHQQFGWRSYAMQWNPDGTSSTLPQVPSSRGEWATAINATGIVVGWTELVAFDVRAVRWDAQGPHILPSGGGHAVAQDVNDDHRIAGYLHKPDGFMHPATWSPSNALTILALPAGDNFGFASGINNRGQVVGTAGVTDGPDLTHHAVVWAPDGTPTVIPNSEQGAALKINDAGVVVGYVEDVSPELLGQTGAIWINGERIFAPPSPTARTIVNDLNETQLAGAFYPNSEPHAARWSFTSSDAHFEFNGFFAPVRNPGSTAPYVVNRAKAGQAIPVKFSLNGNKGLNVLADGYPRSKTVPCTLTDTAGGEPTRAAGSTRLSYRKGADQYSYVWKTEKAWAGTCRQLMVGLTDGSIHTALFKFTK